MEAQTTLCERCWKNMATRPYGKERNWKVKFNLCTECYNKVKGSEKQ